MAYREFDPVKMEDYQTETVNLLNKQSEAVDQQITSMKNQITTLTVAMTAALLVAATAMKILVTANGDMEIPDTATRAAAALTAKGLETQITSLKSQIQSLEGEKLKIATAIQETNKFIKKLKDQIENLNSDSVATMEELIRQIDRYKDRMKELYNRVGSTLVNFGYDANEINQQDKFAGVVENFGDANIVQSVPFVPASYIYKDGALNQKILYGIFKKELSAFNVNINKNIKDASLQQFSELSNALNSIAKSGNLDQLGRFLSAAYTNISTGVTYQDELYPNSPQGSTYYANLSEVYKSFASFYTSGASTQALIEILNGSTLNNLNQETKNALQMSGVLTGLIQQAPSLHLFHWNGNEYPQNQNMFNISSVKFNGGHESALKISTNDLVGYLGGSNSKSSLNWYVTEFTPRLFDQNLNLQKLDENLKLDEINFYYAGQSYLDGLKFFNIPTDFETMASNQGGKAVSELNGNVGKAYKNGFKIWQNIQSMKKYENQLKDNLSSARVDNVILLLNYGGVYILGRDHSLTASSTFLELNGSNGIGLGANAYNYIGDGNENIPLLIGTTMFSPKSIFTYANSVDYIDWANKNEGAISGYEQSLQYAADKLGTPLPLPENVTYQDYLNIINNPNTPALIEEYYALKRKLTDD